MAKAEQMAAKSRELTGRAVLFWLLGFFAVTIGVNAVMVRVATKTFGGVETESSYKAGLVFKQDIEAAAQQEFAPLASRRNRHAHGVRRSRP